MHHGVLPHHRSSAIDSITVTLLARFLPIMASFLAHGPSDRSTGLSTTISSSSRSGSSHLKRRADCRSVSDVDENRSYVTNWCPPPSGQSDTRSTVFGPEQQVVVGEEGNISGRPTASEEPPEEAGATIAHLINSNHEREFPLHVEYGRALHSRCPDPLYAAVLKQIVLSGPQVATDALRM